MGVSENALASMSGIDGFVPVFSEPGLSGPAPSASDDSLPEFFFTSQGNSLIEINYNRKN